MIPKGWSWRIFRTLLEGCLWPLCICCSLLISLETTNGQTHNISQFSNHSVNSLPLRSQDNLRLPRAPNSAASRSIDAVCEARGRGTNEFASCPQKSCRANVDCWVAYGKPQQCVCDPNFCGLICLPVGSRCPPPYRPSNGFVTFRDSKIGDTVDYSCAPAFTVMGPRKRHCLGTLRWSGPEPICTNQTDFCFSPPFMPNTIVLAQNDDGEDTGAEERNDYRSGESITMTCRGGFEDTARKYSTVLCVGNQWKYEKLDCQRISCPEIDGPTNGRTLYTSDLRYQASAVQFCNDGFQINCSFKMESETSASEDSCTRMCQVDGTWSEANAECIPVQCPQLKKPEHGSITGYWTTVNNVVGFACDEGFELIGSRFRRCQLDGKWDGDPVTCKVRDCGPPPTVQFASVKFASTVYNSKAYFKCESGTLPSVNSSELVCRTWQDRTMWLPQPYPSCHRHCMVPTVDNSRSDVLGTNNVAETTNEPATDKVLVIHNTLLKVTCNPGYNIGIGDASPRLQTTTSGHAQCLDGRWNVTYKCIPARCRVRPPNTANAIVRFYSFSHGSKVRYECLPGYAINVSIVTGSEAVIADNDGSHRPPKVAVAVKIREADRSLKLSGRPIKHDKYSVGCNFGEWKGAVPKCIPITCKRPQVGTGLQVHLIGARGRWPFNSDSILPTHGAAVEFSCREEGHRVLGTRHSFCMEGEWSPPPPTMCQLITHAIIPRRWLFYKP